MKVSMSSYTDYQEMKITVTVDGTLLHTELMRLTEGTKAGVSKLPEHANPSLISLLDILWKHGNIICMLLCDCKRANG